MTASTRVDEFEELRPHLLAVAYRLTGTVADAEDIVQDAWLRWDGTSESINDHIPIISEMPHGGLGASGFGKDMSDYSLEEYLTIKHVMSDITGIADKDWHRTIFTKR